MAGMADEDDVPAPLDRALGLAMDLRHQRAGGVDIVEPARLRFCRHRLWYPVGAEHHRHVVGDLIERFDENRALCLQRIHDIAIVDDLVPDIDGRAEALDRQRSEEHTSELQSLMRISYAVFCLKKKTNTKHLRIIDAKD